ncbi:MAG: GNAT family N-acetyltransferase [Alphaproteobacteria bacterium]|jgi:hypothetical protein|nr:GNAT family N-acetyltransferase [Alphaproteobacteria bacterium]
MGDFEPDTVTVRIAGGMAEIPAADWDACAGTDNPFLRHAFLEALEESGCVRPETGWAPYHVVIEDEDGRLQGGAPLYLKGHSRGEFIFDYGWADAYERAGGQYYPKLLSAVPFTPVTGPRLLSRPGLDRTEMIDKLASGCIAVARQLEVSSLHINFPTETEWRRLGALGLLQRTDQQFHWLNEGYDCFDDFLGALTSRKRKTIRKERRGAQESGIEIEVIGGDRLTEAHWDAFYGFYQDTGSRKWGRPYLNRQFFSLIGERMANEIALVMCSRDGRWIAGALNFVGSETLFGRYWGCIEDHRFLHFEACYYQAIDYAIRHGLKCVEAGAQGPHKLARGYLPTHIYSAHWISERRFRDAVEDYLQHERREVDRDIAHLAEYAPFKNDQGTAENE